MTASPYLPASCHAFLAYLVVIGDLHQFTKISLRLLDDTVKDLAAVAHFHNGHAASAVIQHFIRRFL